MDDQYISNDDDDDGGDWITTFADMATLLMAFFVLLLSFAEMDVEKYAAVVGSMKQALGVDAKSEKKFLKVDKKADPNSPTCQVMDSTPVKVKVKDTSLEEALKKKAQVIRKHLKKQIEESTVTVERTSNFIVIRLPEQGMFGGGNASVGRRFKGVLKQIRAALENVDGEVVVAGHTDDRPIKSRAFRSNWDLSSERAVSVLHEILKSKKLDPSKLSAVGYGSSRPLKPNTTKKNRAMNRRVEVVVKQLAPKKVAPEPEADKAKDGTKDAKADGASAKDDKKAGDVESETPPGKKDEKTKAKAKADKGSK